MSDEKIFPIEEMELRASLMLAAGKAVYITLQQKYKDEYEGRKMIEEAIEEVIAIIRKKHESN